MSQLLTPKRQLEHNGAAAATRRSQTIGEVHDERACYVCRQPYESVRFFYDQLCIDCGDFNFTKRTQIGGLRGQVVLVTVARMKIGFQATA